MPQESLLGQLYFREMFYMLSANTKNYDKQEGNESASAPNNCLQILLLCLRVCQSYVTTIHEFLDLRLTSEVQQTNPVMLCAIVRGEVLLASAVGARPGLREGLGGGQGFRQREVQIERVVGDNGLENNAEEKVPPLFKALCNQVWKLQG